jgi:O2-independent ubiquinone biosynthesis accessory factor UbiT
MTALTFPTPLRKLVEYLPARPPSLVLTAMLNLALGRILHKSDLKALYGKRIAVRVTDIGLHFHFSVDSQGFSTVASALPADLTFSATARDFWLLATRREDPDTLFFSRRLLVEGDTELGLIAKNTLDSLDLSALALTMRPPFNLLSKVGEKLFGH